MIVLRLELHSAETRKIEEIGRLLITNDGTGSVDYSHYDVHTLKGRTKEQLNRGFTSRSGRVINHPRKNVSVWVLVHKAIESLGY